MATLALTTDEILQAIGLVAGISRNPADHDAQTQSDIRAMIRAGMRSFFNPLTADGQVHTWRFLERPFVAGGETPYVTGTVTVASGTVTLTGGTWPAWAADGMLVVGGQAYVVSGRTSDSVLTLGQLGVSETAAAFTLYRWRYPLPADFAEFIGGVVYQRQNYGKPLRPVTDSEVRLRWATNFRLDDPLAYAVQACDSNDTTGWYVHVWPNLPAAASIAGVYRSAPEDELDADDLTDTSVIHIESVHAGTLLAAICAATEEYYFGQPGVQAAKYDRLLRASIAHDRATQGPVGIATDPRIDQRAYALFNHTPIYNDTL